MNRGRPVFGVIADDYTGATDVASAIRGSGLSTALLFGDMDRIAIGAMQLIMLWGLVLTFGALLFKEQGTPVVVIALSIASFTQGGLLGGFFLGLFWHRANQRDATWRTFVQRMSSRLAMGMAWGVASRAGASRSRAPAFRRNTSP